MAGLALWQMVLKEVGFAADPREFGNAVPVLLTSEKLAGNPFWFISFLR